jgi:predicted enzyme related to lactoylglutathione lyase
MSFHGLPCWYELATPDLTAAAAFYGQTLGWTVADSGTPGMQYHIASMGKATVAGMMQAEPGQPQAWGIYFAVDSADATAAKATSLGAKLIVPPADIPGTGRFAVLIDPQGAAFSILQPLPMQTPPEAAAFDQSRPGHGAWHELITPNPTAALTFYGDLFGWTESAQVPMGPDMTYHLIARAGKDIGGTCALPGASPHWKPYFGVPSVKASAALVTQAGGTVIHGPDEVPGGAFTLQIKDAQGIPLALTGPA